MPTNISHNEEVEEILSRPPSWMLRYGLISMLLFFTLFTVVAAFISYPDVISAPVTITTEFPPIHLQTNTTGRIDTLLLTDGSYVEKGQKILILESPASYTDVTLLDQYLDTIIQLNNDSTKSPFDLINFIFRSLQIGNMQDGYTELSSRISEHIAYLNTEDFAGKENSFRKQIYLMEGVVNQNYCHEATLSEKFELAYLSFTTDSLLYKQQVITSLEFYQSKTKYLDKKNELNSSSNSILQSRLQLETKTKELLDLRIGHQERIALFKSFVKRKCFELKDAISVWEFQYVVKSPINGTVYLLGMKQSQTLTIGKELITVVPIQTGDTLAIMNVPIQGSSKVQVGQKVIISLANYPSEIYGNITGQVRSVSLLPKDSAYLVEICLVNGVKSNLRRNIDYKPSMVGHGEIITENMSLLDRLLGVLATAGTN